MQGQLSIDSHNSHPLGCWTFLVGYPQPNNQSALQQLQIQLAKPLPYDLDATQLSEYKDLVPKWHNWANVEAELRRLNSNDETPGM